MNREEKQTEVELVSKWLSESQVTLCADYRGLTVAQISEFRRQLRQNGSKGRVVKNTLAKIAAERALQTASPAELKKFLDLFQGPSFVVSCESDPIAPAKVAAKFAKENAKLKVKGAWLDGKFVDAGGVEELSKLPSREEILAKLLSLMNAPASRLLQLLQAPGAQMVRVINAQRAKLEGQGAAGA